MGDYKDQQQFLAKVVEDIILTECRPLLRITLNTHRVVSNAVCRRRAERMFHVLHRRCFRSARYEATRTAELLRIVGALERGPNTDHTHLHLLAWVHPAELVRFMRIVPARWLSVSPGGQVHLRQELNPRANAGALAWYLTKGLDQERFRDGFFTEEDLGLPSYGGRLPRFARKVAE